MKPNRIGPLEDAVVEPPDVEESVVVELLPQPAMTALAAVTDNPANNSSRNISRRVIFIKKSEAEATLLIHNVDRGALFRRVL